MTPTTQHLTEEEIAQLLDPGIDGSVTREAFLHLGSCQQCLGDYQYAAREAGVLDAEVPRPARQILEAGMAVAPTPPRATRRRFPMLAATAASIAVVASIWAWQSGREANGLDPALTAPIQTAIIEVSNRALLVIPGSERSLIGNPAAYRSSYVVDDEEVTASLRKLVDINDSTESGREVAYWMIAGFLATGQLAVAGDLAADAVRRYPGDGPIATLDGLVQFGSGDFVSAEATFRSVLGKDPDYAPAIINLALALQHQQRPDEARELLDRIRSDDQDAVAARARAIAAE